MASTNLKPKMSSAPRPPINPAISVPTQFHKMHGAGNDFVLLDFRQSNEDMSPALARLLADRKKGVGCDQVLVLKPSDKPGCAARYEIYNADGSLAGQCGNGVRCIALYLVTRGEPVSDGQAVRLQGPAGIVSVLPCEDGEFECAMGVPAFEPTDIPVDEELATRSDDEWLLEINGQALRVGLVSMGNPHAVTIVASSAAAPVGELGPMISTHPAFPDGCNAGFAELVSREQIRLRVHERGAGETLACGSGACAAVAFLRNKNLVDERVEVLLPGGHLVIKWSGRGNQLTMKGPATHVFRGTLDE